MSSDCLGCKLANGEVITHVIYEDEVITCFLDIAPMNEGHLLLLPKKHYLDLDELDDITAAAILKASSKLSKIIKDIYKPDGVTIIQNGGKFNDLQHYHMHVFPRYEADGFAWVEPEDKNNNKNRLEETKERILNHIKKNNFEIKEVKVLIPEELSELLTESAEEGFRHIHRLINDYIAGINKFNNEGEALFECRVNNRVIGICGLNQDPYFGEGIGRVRRLYIMKEFRRHGIGRKMTEAVINKAKKHYRKLLLKTDNPVAGEFYKTLGFEEIMNEEKMTHCLVLI
ncbi:Diadenosine tetraphosphate (Ap4A) hydrolase [Paenibacillus sp. yr247]|uniref:GNAT family N-acetyltransferase n=1 Tax=Paenibacillus sp. yr247 TaxID=1761880 RepID=UPI000882C133|nr:GNAT family N-acetyltransferase [Paenibacillus sp. yr247]SDN02808.1 Diadenosine tetraphosphate (Ap4A) hydrolase [Paenibacillus sp. yr247]